MGNCPALREPGHHDFLCVPSNKGMKPRDGWGSSVYPFQGLKRWKTEEYCTAYKLNFLPSAGYRIKWANYVKFKNKIKLKKKMGHRLREGFSKS